MAAEAGRAYVLWAATWRAPPMKLSLRCGQAPHFVGKREQARLSVMCVALRLTRASFAALRGEVGGYISEQPVRGSE